MSLLSCFSRGLWFLFSHHAGMQTHVDTEISASVVFAAVLMHKTIITYRRRRKNWMLLHTMLLQMFIYLFISWEQKKTVYSLRIPRGKPDSSRGALGFHTLLLPRNENICVIICEASSQTNTQPVSNQRAQILHAAASLAALCLQLWQSSRHEIVATRSRRLHKTGKLLKIIRADCLSRRPLTWVLTAGG